MHKEPDPKDGLGSLTLADVALVEATQVKLIARVAKATAKYKAKVAKTNASTSQQDAKEESTNDDKEHEEVFTLGRMNTQSQTRVSWYFTAKEVEAEEAIQVDIIGKGIKVDIAEAKGESDDDIEPEYDPSEDDDDDFDQDLDGDQDVADENMD
jgi:hypothetical protein